MNVSVLNIYALTLTFIFTYIFCFLDIYLLSQHKMPIAPLKDKINISCWYVFFLVRTQGIIWCTFYFDPLKYFV